jgi:hypothetical protein
MFPNSGSSDVEQIPIVIVPVRPATDPGQTSDTATRGLLRRTLGRYNPSRRTFGQYHPSRRTFGISHPSRRTFGRYQPSRRTFGIYHP